MKRNTKAPQTFIALCIGLLLVATTGFAQLGGMGLGNSVGNSPLNGGANRNGIGNSRLQISNGISNGTIGLTPNAPASGPSLLPGNGITAPTMGTFGNPGGGPGGGNPPGGGVFNAPLDSWMFILIALGIVVFLLLRRKELQQHKQ